MALKDKVLDFYLSDFLKRKYGSTTIDQTEAFEHFVNYCIVSRIDPDAFELTGISDLRVGGKNDTGIDGIAFFVNDRLIRNVGEIELFKKSARRLDVEFVFLFSLRHHLNLIRARCLNSSREYLISFRHLTQAHRMNS